MDGTGQDKMGVRDQRGWTNVDYGAGSLKDLGDASSGKWDIT